MERPSKESNLCYCNYRPQYLSSHMVSSSKACKLLYFHFISMFLDIFKQLKIRFRFHPRVNRCYCPSKEVAKRALYDGLEESQIQVFGLPIRPSFARAVLSKVEDLTRHNKTINLYMMVFFLCILFVYVL